MTCVFDGFSRSLLADIHALMSLKHAVNVWTAAVVILTATLYSWLSSAYWCSFIFIPWRSTTWPSSAVYGTWSLGLILDPQGWVSSRTGTLNPMPCHVGWPQDKAAQGKHKTLPLLVLRDRLEATLRRTCTWRTRPGRRAGRRGRTSGYIRGPTRAGSWTTLRSDQHESRRLSCQVDRCTYTLQTRHVQRGLRYGAVSACPSVRLSHSILFYSILKVKITAT